MAHAFRYKYTRLKVVYKCALCFELSTLHQFFKMMYKCALLFLIRGWDFPKRVNFRFCHDNDCACCYTNLIFLIYVLEFKSLSESHIFVLSCFKYICVYFYVFYLFVGKCVKICEIKYLKGERSECM